MYLKTMIKLIITKSHMRQLNKIPFSMQLSCAIFRIWCWLTWGQPGALVTHKSNDIFLNQSNKHQQTEKNGWLFYFRIMFGLLNYFKCGSEEVGWTEAVP